ncbi:asparaginase [Halobacteriaceae archaeon GCM10025711]
MDVAVLSTGGTIASTDADDGARPTKTGSELLEAMPELGEYAEISVEEITQVPSFDIEASTLETLGERVAALDDEAVDAVVVTHGTDTMEETAYYLDAALHPETPVFLTGAQRRTDETSADGPANLLATFRAARAFHDADASGVFVVFNEEVHAARTVSKTHTSNLAAFTSPGVGPVATVDHAGVQLHRTPTSETVHVPTTALDATVHVVKSGLGVSGTLLDAALERGADGVVVEGTGLGNASKGISRAVADAATEVPVVVTSRCPAGRTAPVYGGVGGGERLREHGAVFAGDLPAQKARLKLQLALSLDETGGNVRDVFGEATN